jgi:hypothetical protein
MPQSDVAGLLRGLLQQGEVVNYRQGSTHR